MKHTSLRLLLLIAFSCVTAACRGQSVGPSQTPDTIRIATFNLEDIRTEDLLASDHPRLERIAQIIGEINPDIILLNEIAFNFGSDSLDRPEVGNNTIRLADKYLNHRTSGKHYDAYMPFTNTGVPSGFDLDHDGDTVLTPPVIPPSTPESPGRQTPEGRAYGNDAWGFGMFPGQYGLGLLVSDRFEIVYDSIRSFRMFGWADLPDANRPVDPQTGKSWYSDEAWDQFRLSSKTHVDIPVRVAPGEVIHVLASHPTPPAFDGPEARNKLRNHDEISFWKYYLDGSPVIVDDAGRRGGLDPQASFVIMGDLNADPDEGSSFGNPITTYLLSHPRVNASFVPRSDLTIERLDSDDTAGWGLRVDYVLPSNDLTIIDGGIYRHFAESGEPLSDHFPVWIDVQVPEGP
jgi:hypothetical protein